MTHSWFHWLRSGSARKPARRTRRTSRPRRSNVPELLVLEDRTVLSVLTVLNNADSGAGSLRAAVAAAQSGDTIVFDPSLAYETITLSSGPLALSSNLTIDGLGADLLAISGNNASQLFTLSGTAQVTLANLTLTGGMSSQGGAVYIGGTAALTLDSDILSGNQAVGDANGNALGGAVYNSAGASLTIDNTSFVNNQTNGTNNSFGGAIANAGTLSINGATFAGNAALGSTAQRATRNREAARVARSATWMDQPRPSPSAPLPPTRRWAPARATPTEARFAIEDAGVFPFTGFGVTLTVSQCTFANNSATGGSNAGNSDFAPNGGGGGAIRDQPGTNLTVLNCTFTGNQANSGGGNQAFGGAIDNSPADTITISDSQFISNSAIGSSVGAFVLAGAVDNSQTMAISDCQFTNNSAIGSGVGAQASGGALGNFDTMTIANCLFTGNSAEAGPMADGVNTFGQAAGGAILTGEGSGVILTLSNSIVAGNEAIGGSGGNTLPFDATDFAFGGGIANVVGGTLNVAGCTITGNQSIGGASASGPGGPANGGGIVNYQGTLNLKDSTVSANFCQGGAGASGAAGGETLGGGIDSYLGSVAILTNSTISFNECLGGPGGAGANGGDAKGGGLASGSGNSGDASSLVVSNCQLIGNVAQGGTEDSSAVGGDAMGGGLFVRSGTAILQGVLVSGNQAQGGTDSQGNTTGQGLGGGVYVDPSASATADMQTLIAGNQASMSNDDVWGTITIGP